MIAIAAVPQLMPAQLVVQPNDSRCRWWAKVIPATALVTLDPGNVSGANALPGTYLSPGADVVLEPGDLLITGEANHHRKSRGWTIQGYLCVAQESLKNPGQYGVMRVPLGAQVKARILSKRRDLKSGTGDHAAIVRAARFCVEGVPEDEIAVNLRALRAP